MRKISGNRPDGGLLDLGERPRKDGPGETEHGKPDHDGLGTYKKTTGKRLDWILVSRDLEFRKHEVLPDVVADHFAVFAELAYRGQQE